MRIAVFWGSSHTMPGKCDDNTWYSFYNSGWKYGFEQLGHEVDYFMWDDNEDHPGYDLYVYAPGFLTQTTCRKKVHKPNVFFTEEASLGISWAVNHSFHYDAVCFLDFMNWKSMKANGVKNAYWVPGAVDPTVFHPLNIERVHTAAFLGTFDGSVVFENGLTRMDYIKTIDSKIEGSLVARNFYAFEANKVWNRSKIGVDVPIVDFCSFRLFQIIAAGSFCLTRKSRIDNGIKFLLPPSECYYGEYKNLDDLINEWVPTSLNLIKLFPSCVEKTRQYVLGNNTFEQRAKQLLQIAKLEPREEKLFYLEENFNGR